MYQFSMSGHRKCGSHQQKVPEALFSRGPRRDHPTSGWRPPQPPLPGQRADAAAQGASRHVGQGSHGGGGGGEQRSQAVRLIASFGVASSMSLSEKRDPPEAVVIGSTPRRVVGFRSRSVPALQCVSEALALAPVRGCVFARRPGVAPPPRGYRPALPLCGRRP